MDSATHEHLIINRSFKDVNPLICGWQECESGHDFGPASRPFYLLHYVLSGCGTFKNSEGVYNVNRGQIFVIKPFEITYYKADKKTPWTYCWVGFSCNTEFSEILNTPVINAQNCEHIFLSLKNLGNIENGREIFICSKIYELFAMLMQSSVKDSHRADRSIEYVLKAKNYIETKYADDISVAKIARHLGLERSYFSHLFHKHAGVSPQKYLVDLRLTKAAQLISLHGYTPTEAALSTGYHDAVNFSRMFKSRFGVPPSMYGKNKEV